MFESLFDLFLKQVENNEKDTNIFKVFLNNMIEEYNSNTTSARKVIDYIAGMTDEYFVNQYNEYFNK